MNGYALVTQLLKAHMTEEAAELAALLAEREEQVPRLKALEYELVWLLTYVRREGTPVTIEQAREGEVVTWRRMEAARFGGDHGEYVVLPGCPRLEEILEGKLPSLAAFREGRTP